jgi:hypothetical protein
MRAISADDVVETLRRLNLALVDIPSCGSPKVQKHTASSLLVTGSKNAAGECVVY